MSEEFGNIKAQKMNAQHGNLGTSPNAMYKKYCGWHSANYGETQSPLSFKSWLQWAAKKNIVRNFSVDANETKTEKEIQTLSKTERVGRAIAITSIIISVVAITINVFRISKQD